MHKECVESFANRRRRRRRRFVARARAPAEGKFERRASEFPEFPFSKSFVQAVITEPEFTRKVRTNTFNDRARGDLPNCRAQLENLCAFVRENGN